MKFKDITLPQEVVCPFCGNDYIQIKSDIAIRGDKVLLASIVLCDACKAEVPLLIRELSKTTNEDLIKEAMKKWNTRK